MHARGGRVGATAVQYFPAADFATSILFSLYKLCDRHTKLHGTGNHQADRIRGKASRYVELGRGTVRHAVRVSDQHIVRNVR